MLTTLKTILIIFASILLSGCYTMYTIPPSEYNNLHSEHEKIEVTLNNKEKIVVEENEPILYNDSEKTFQILTDSVATDISLENIKEIREERFDVVKTIFSSVWLIVIGLAVFGVIAGVQLSGH